jgi:protocatechuate 3,4-dioxygenase beta subunit
MEVTVADNVPAPSRRFIIVSGALAVLGPARVLGQPLPPTPACHDGDKPTVPETEGPFFKPASPLRADLREPGIVGKPVELSGFVLTRSCKPIANALVDLWHADDDGKYDDKGFHLRGHQFTDRKGWYAFRTILPGLYPGRTRHFHVKVTAAAESPVLTTQFYFPDEPRNRTDDLFRPDLLMQVTTADDAMRARFDVVLAQR